MIETPAVVVTPTADSSARRTVARAMRLGLYIWPTFTVLDVYMCFVAYPDAPFGLFLVYRVLVSLAFYAVYRAAASRHATVPVTRLFWLQNMCYGLAALTIAIMAVHLGGVRSPYMHGISIVALVRATLVPSHWRRGLKTYARIALSFPVVMAVGAFVSPAARSDWLSAQSLIVFASNYVFVVASSFIGMVTGHIVWSAHEQLYRARRLGRYRLEAPIGKGGMGEVWLAWDQRLNRDVALKILRVGTAPSPDMMRRFELEAQAAGQLRGPHVVKIFDCGASDDGLYYIAMEYLAGMNLATVVERFGPLPAARAIHLTMQACEALEEAHAAKIIHRDLKPHNLYLTRGEAEPDFIKLLDFGIARLRVEGGGNEHLTRTGTMVGTPAYLAPEVWQGAVADERSDIYSLGVTLHFLLTGLTPFEDMSLTQLQAAHLMGKPLQLRLDRCGADGERLRPLLLRCLARLPDERVQSARELREALAALHDPATWTRADAETFWSMAGPAMTRAAATGAVQSPHSELLDGATRLAPGRSTV
jgi:eukaryotic-like serine/threonine-protein kinase